MTDLWLIEHAEAVVRSSSVMGGPAAMAASARPLLWSINSYLQPDLLTRLGSGLV